MRNVTERICCSLFQILAWILTTTFVFFGAASAEPSLVPQQSVIKPSAALEFSIELKQFSPREISLLKMVRVKGRRIIPGATSAFVVGCVGEKPMGQVIVATRYGKIRLRRLLRLLDAIDSMNIFGDKAIRIAARLSNLEASLSNLLLECQGVFSPPGETPTATPGSTTSPTVTPSPGPSTPPTSTSTPSPSATSTSTPAATPSRTPTRTPTTTPSPTIAPTITPTATSTVIPRTTPTMTPTPTTTPSIPSETSMVTSVSRHGITWTFSAPHRVGYFINGDPFVVGSATIVGISPLPSIQNGRYINGSMINPIPEAGQGYDSTGSGFTASLFRGLNVSVGAPLVVPIGSSLISSQSSFAGGISVVERAAVLTTIPSIPTMGSFRPPYSGTSKTVKYNVAQLRTWMLQSLAVVPNTPTVDSVAGPLENVQIDHIGDWGGQAIHPRQAMDNYGRNLASQRSVAQLMTHLSLNAAQKLRLVVALVQVGIDDWGNIQNGLVNQGDGGHGNGRIGGVHYALALLGDTTEMAAAGRNPDLATRISEYGQFQYVDNRYYSGLCTGSGFNQSDIGLPEFTFRSYPEQFGSCHAIASWTAPAQTNDYRNCCTMNGILGQLLSSRMMGIKNQWNHPAIFDYEDRYMDALRTPVSWHKYWYVWPLHPNPAVGYHSFPENMYTSYRQNFGAVWRCTDHYSNFQCYR